MGSELVYATIKRTIGNYLPDARILLFGSRARGTEDSQSDYDLLVITPQLFTQREKISWNTLLHKALLKVIHAPFDLLLFSEEEVLQKQELPGHIVRSALREGVAL